MASPLKREVSPTVAVVVIVLILAVVVGVYWYLSGGSSAGESKGPAKPIQPPPNLKIPRGVGGVGAPGTTTR
ncbi:MAG: hypothetical protein ACUVSV_01280 [Armatimonadota bacterium]